MKFKVGDRVRWQKGNTVDIGQILAYQGTPVQYKVSFLSDYSFLWCGEEALELIQPTSQEPVVEDPIPGKFYRTRDGKKVMFVGLAIDGEYLYQGTDYEEIRNYSLPFTYSDDSFTNDRDIVSEWVDEVTLPAVEIKRWAIVLIIDSVGHKRGEVMITCADKQFLEESYKQDLKLGVVALVELVGILPPSDAGKSTGTLSERKI